MNTEHSQRSEHSDTWILVGSASRARIFSWGADGAKQRLQLVRELEHPESRLANQDLVSDRPGRAQQAVAPSRLGPSVGPSKGNRSGMEPRTSPKTVEHEHFAHDLAQVLEKGLNDHAYQRLVLVAGPEFLGLMRQVLPAQVQKHVQASLDKDYTSDSEQELSARLSTLLRGNA